MGEEEVSTVRLLALFKGLCESRAACTWCGERYAIRIGSDSDHCMYKKLQVRYRFDWKVRIRFYVIWSNSTEVLPVRDTGGVRLDHARIQNPEQSLEGK